MRKLSARRRRVAVLGAVVSAMSLLAISLGRHSLWVMLPIIGLEVVVVAYMMKEVVALKSEE